MELISHFINIVMHLDVYLAEVIQNYGTWTYLILFTIIFCETGLVVTPFLPGDSLLFTAGALAALGSLDPVNVSGALIAAAVIGDSTNYWIGHFVGPKVFSKENVRFLNKKHLEHTHRFYERYGAKTVFIARFVPIVRSFAPFVAGVGRMKYGRFIIYSISGSIAWVSSFVLGGYFFGNIPIVKKNFTLAILMIIFISILPGIIEFLRHKKTSKK